MLLRPRFRLAFYDGNGFGLVQSLMYYQTSGLAALAVAYLVIAAVTNIDTVKSCCILSPYLKLNMGR